MFNYDPVLQLKGSGKVMDKALVGQRVANRLFATEKAVDTAMSEAAFLMTSLIEARTEMGLSAVVGDNATTKVAQAIATLAEARRAVVSAHGDLADLKLRVGIRTKLVGVTDKMPEIGETTDMRRVG